MPIKRYLFEELVAHVPKKEISLIVGPRQAGKTTLMLQLQDHLEKNDKDTLFLSLDLESDMPHFTTQTALLYRIRLEFGKNKEKDLCGKKGYSLFQKHQERDQQIAGTLF